MGSRLVAKLGLAPVPDKVGTRDNKMYAKSGDNKNIKGYNVAANLLEVLNNPKASPQSRAAAGRTLAEMEGLIGRHQAAPDRGSITPVSSLSRADLETELARLRDKLNVKL